MSAPKWIGMALVAVLFSGCKSEEMSQWLRRVKGVSSEETRLPVKVKTLAVGSPETLPDQVFSGQVEPKKSVVLTAPYGGTLTRLAAHKGQRVAEGQEVAEVLSQSIVSALQIAEASLDQARDANERLGIAYGSGAIPEVQKIDIETQLAKAEAAAAAARHAVENGTMKAPYKGIIGELYADQGVEVLPGQSIALLMDISALKIRIDVHENDINNIVVGTRALVSVPALGLENIPAVVSERGYVASPLTRSYSCILKLSRTYSKLMPGMVVKARFAVRGSAGGQRIVVPAAAVQMDTEGKYVWTVVDDRVRKVRIVPGGYSGRGIIVSEGLSVGDRVIVEGYQKVSTGMKVTE